MDWFSIVVYDNNIEISHLNQSLGTGITSHVGFKAFKLGKYM